MESKLKSHAQTNNLTDVVGGASKIIVFSVFRVKMFLIQVTEFWKIDKENLLE